MKKMSPLRDSDMTTNLNCNIKFTGRGGDNTLDIIAGILLIRMILGHYLTMAHLDDSILFKSLNVLFFYMLWFFFKSGMFCSAEKKENKSYLTNNFNKFIVQKKICFTFSNIYISYTTQI